MLRSLFFPLRVLSHLRSHIVNSSGPIFKLTVTWTRGVSDDFQVMCDIERERFPQIFSFLKRKFGEVVINLNDKGVEVRKSDDQGCEVGEMLKAKLLKLEYKGGSSGIIFYILSAPTVFNSPSRLKSNH